MWKHQTSPSLASHMWFIFSIYLIVEWTSLHFGHLDILWRLLGLFFTVFWHFTDMNGRLIECVRMYTVYIECLRFIQWLIWLSWWLVISFFTADTRQLTTRKQKIEDILEDSGLELLTNSCRRGHVQTDSLSFTSFWSLFAVRAAGHLKAFYHVLVKVRKNIILWS